MEPNELNEKPKFNWKRLLITVGIVIVTAGAIGGSIYYVMNQQAQKDKESAEKTAQDLQTQVSTLETQVADLKKTTTTTEAPTTTQTTTVATSDIDSLRTFCVAGNSDTVVANLVYDSNQDGIYGGCGIGSKSQPGGGAFLIAKKINGAWTKIWVGNGSVDKALITQYKIPVYIYPHQLLDN